MPTRPAAVAGTWYPGTRRRADARCRPLPPGCRLTGPAVAIRAVIAPHAGLMFSGPVGAHAYKAACRRTRRHRRAGRAIALRGVRRGVDLSGGRVCHAARRRRDRRRPGAVADGITGHPADASGTPARAFAGDAAAFRARVSFLKRVSCPLVMGFQTRETITALAAALAQVCTSGESCSWPAPICRTISTRARRRSSTAASHAHVAAFDAGRPARDLRALSGARARALRRLRRRPCHRGDDGGAVARRDGRAGAEVRALRRSLRRLDGVVAISPRRSGRSSRRPATPEPHCSTDDQRRASSL